MHIFEIHLIIICKGCLINNFFEEHFIVFILSNIEKIVSGFLSHYYKSEVDEEISGKYKNFEHGISICHTNYIFHAYIFLN